jgi:hypothetical protein
MQADPTFSRGEYENGCLLGCSAVQTGVSLPTSQGDEQAVRADDSQPLQSRQYRSLKRR